MTEYEQIQRRVARVRRLSTWLDSRFRIPGTKIRLGLDSLVGVLPGAGDAASAVVSLWLISEAARLGVPVKTLTRMLLNVLADSTLGAIPIVGDLFDIFWKSNLRNAELLEAEVKRIHGIGVANQGGGDDK
ncbi:DUF4112 domain-containing protein [Rhodopirellula sp. MGV]|uniref:DUF4112 domain-containing protein n=1 Tax=Rhodopirellula sp. MGV TaxID=2023130 RepID=UPI000B9717C3|nr:DUF4112 domain-containing protein [Rhodopirellula sp. MGV]OYP38398.1 hypothetical protein CGZ80_02310 [Rhodopirellula sp. MGV]PNY34182.1 DUF4112 domain-containing protein [Rhodopirellula baltica]